MSDTVTGNKNTMSLQRPPNVCNYRPLCLEKTYHAGSDNWAARQPQLHAQAQLVARLKIHSQQADTHSACTHHCPHRSQTQGAHTNSFTLLFSLSRCRSPEASAQQTAGTGWDTLDPQYPTPPQFCPQRQAHTHLATGDTLILQPLQQLARTPWCLQQLAPSISHFINPLTSWSSSIFTSSNVLPHISILAPVLQHR